MKEPTPFERLEKYISIPYPPSNKCWEWKGHINYKGYGICYRKPQGGEDKAHRAVYRLLKGEIPKGVVLDHLCRNRKCVNPNHMEIVDQRTNILRGTGSSARNAVKKVCPRCGGNYTKFLKGKHVRRKCIRCEKESVHRYWITHKKVAAVSRVATGKSSP